MCARRPNPPHQELSCQSSREADSSVGAGEERRWSGDACVALGGEGPRAEEQDEGDAAFIIPYSKDENKLFSDSINVGCAKTPSRKTVYGTFPIIAISRADIISPPSRPSIAQPRIWDVSASTIAFIKPRVSSTSSALAT